ncbi:MAG: MASE1 domain-containing protein, partial [Actinomycetota bacterium]
IYFDMSFADVWPKYVVGDALGVLVVAPVFLCWFGRRHYRSSLETATLIVSLSLITLLVFRNWEARWDASLPFLVIPPLTWASLRFGVRGAAAASFVVAQVANASTALGYGPFAIAGTTTHAVTLLQLFVAVTVVSALALAAVTEDLLDRREVEKRLSAQNKELQTALEEIYKSHLYIRKLEGILPICMNCKSVRSDDDSDWLPLDSYLMTRRDALSLSHTLCPSCAEERAFL